MECRNCGKQNPERARYCIKCSYELTNKDSVTDYCPNCKKPLLYPDKPCPYCHHTEVKTDQSFCSECKSSVKKGFPFSGSKKLNEIEMAVLQLNPAEVFCDKCINSQKVHSLNVIGILKNKFDKFLEEMPVLSIEKPDNMTISKHCKVITAQSIVHTDGIYEFTTKENHWDNTPTVFENKLSIGEETCMISIRKKALKLGANAVIGCDIEYAELGNYKNTFLIAMLGTAVIAEEFEILSDYEQEVYNLI